MCKWGGIRLGQALPVRRSVRDRKPTKEEKIRHIIGLKFKPEEKKRKELIFPRGSLALGRGKGVY